MNQGITAQSSHGDRQQELEKLTEIPPVEHGNDGHAEQSSDAHYEYAEGCVKPN